MLPAADDAPGAAEPGASAIRPGRRGSVGAGSVAGGLKRVGRGSLGSGREEVLDKLRSWAQTLKDVAQGKGSDEHKAALRAAVSPDALRSADSEVRLWAAICLAEGFRIFAPEPPLTARQRQSALELFVEQLHGLAAPPAPRSERIGLLEVLADMRTFMLVFECVGHQEELIVSLVSACLSAARADEHGVLESTLVRLISDVLGECDDVPEAALRALIAELTAPPRRRGGQTRPGDLARRALSTLAHRNAAIAINEFLNKSLYGHPAQDAPAPTEDDDELVESSLAVGQRRDALFRAVYELYVTAPQLVSRVVPHLHADLLCKDPVRRRAVTTLVGRLLAHCPVGHVAGVGQEPLVERHPLLFDRHLERVEDADEGVRLAAWDGAKELLAAAAAALDADAEVGPALRSAVERVAQRLLERSLDPSDEVRLKVVSVASEVASDSPGGFALLAPSLPGICGRILDKRPRVREASAEAAARLYAKHAIPHIAARGLDGLEELAWAPRLLCEAFHVFAQGRCGHGARIEELLEQHVLGCGAKDLGPAQRAHALAALCGAAFADGPSAAGLALLLSRKRDAHDALRRYVLLRIQHGAPLLAAARAPDAAHGSLLQLVAAPGSGEASAAAAAEADAASSAATAAVRELARSSPAAEDRAARPETLLAQLQAFDAVRDRALWQQLERLTRPTPEARTEEMGALLEELDRLLRTHRLTELGSVLRRALLCTWLLPEQVPAVLERWAAEERASPAGAPAGAAGAGRGGRRRGGAAQKPADEAACTFARHTVARLPKYMPGAFQAQAAAIARRMLAPGGADASSPARVALRALASMGKTALSAERSSAAGAPGVPTPTPIADAGAVRPTHALDADGLADGLLEVVASTNAVAESPRGRAAVCRRALRCLALLPAGAPRAAAFERLERWATTRCADVEAAGDAAPLAAMHLASACVEAVAEGLVAAPVGCVERWQGLAREAAMMPGLAGDADILCAAVDLCLAAGEAELLLGGDGLLERAGACSRQAEVQAFALTLRPLRRGLVPLTNDILSSLGARLCASAALAGAAAEEERAPARGGAVEDVEVAIDALQRWQKPTASQARMFDRLRLCVTLPTVLALSPLRRHREAAQRILLAALARAARQQHQHQQEPLLDVATACFVHFLSRLEPFAREAEASASAYPRSSKICELFCEALLRCEPSRKPTELGIVALRVCDRVRYFEDVDRPSDWAVHKAAGVLRHVVEKHCADLGKKVHSSVMQSAPSGSMPAALFAIRQDRAASAPIADAIGAGKDRAASAPIADAIGAGEELVAAAATPLPLPTSQAPSTGGGGGSAGGGGGGGGGSGGGGDGGSAGGRGGGGDVAAVARPMARTSGLFGGLAGSSQKRPAMAGSPTDAKRARPPGAGGGSGAQHGIAV